MRMRILIPVAVTLIMLLLSSCTVFDPYNCGIVSGNAAYLGYSKVAEKQDEDFKSRVEKLWRKVNEIESVDQLIAKVDELEASFDELINNDKLPGSVKDMLIKLKTNVIGKIRELMDKTFISNDEALEYLIGVRDGVNQMIELTEKRE